MIVTIDDVTRDDYNLSPSRHVSTGVDAEVLSLDEAVLELREAEEERTEADRGFKQVLVELGFKD